MQRYTGIWKFMPLCSRRSHRHLRLTGRKPWIPAFAGMTLSTLRGNDVCCLTDAISDVSQIARGLAPLS